jgi:hypothetical protein
MEKLNDKSYLDLYLSDKKIHLKSFFNRILVKEKGHLIGYKWNI